MDCVNGLIPLRGNLLFTFCIDVINGYLLFGSANQKHVRIKFHHYNNLTSLPGLSLLIQAEHVPEFAKTPMNVGFSGQPFQLHVRLGTFHAETLGPTAKKKETKPVSNIHKLANY